MHENAKVQIKNEIFNQLVRTLQSKEFEVTMHVSAPENRLLIYLALLKRPL